MERLKTMFDHHPHPASEAGDEAMAAIHGATECALVCIACADACLAEPDPAPLRECIRLNQECADAAQMTARLLCRAGRQDKSALERALRACAEIARACARECDAHAGAMEHCRVCSEACREAAFACETMIPALVA
ncbi:MAG: four-helix bundle copper-binding protein [Gemmatimonadota bacterium]